MARVFISVGSNIQREQSVQAALMALEQDFAPLTVSTIYESEAVGFAGSNFYNLVVAIDTDWSVDQLYHHLRQIEADNGRVRGGDKFSGRTLDLDLLLYDDLVCSLPTELPRGEILTYAFVLLPLAEIAPALVHPVTGQTYSQLWQSFDDPSQRLWPVENSSNNMGSDL